MLCLNDKRDEFRPQDIPNNCLLLTILALSTEHLRHLRSRTRRHLAASEASPSSEVDKATSSFSYSPLLPPPWALTVAWLSSVVAVLPYASYITFTDLSVSTVKPRYM